MPIRSGRRRERRLALVSVAAALAAAVELAAVPGGPAHGQSATQAFRPRDEDPKELPAGPGRDDTFYACTACHGFKIVAQQGLTREQWDESLAWMTVRHKMPPITGKDRDIILDYLATHFGPKADSGARGWKNPFGN